MMPCLRSRGPTLPPLEPPKELQYISRQDARRAKAKLSSWKRKGRSSDENENRIPLSDIANVANRRCSPDCHEDIQPFGSSDSGPYTSSEEGPSSSDSTVQQQKRLVTNSISSPQLVIPSLNEKDAVLTDATKQDIHSLGACVPEHSLDSETDHVKKRIKTSSEQPQSLLKDDEHFQTPNAESNRPVKSHMEATPRMECNVEVVDIDNEYIGNKYDTKYSKRLDAILLEREEAYLKPAGTYESVQVEVSLNDHSELVDWMAEVAYNQELQVDVLFLAVHLMDCVLKMKPMRRQSFQLLGAACLFLASKLEEVKAISAESIVCLAGNAFKVEDLVKMEIFITAVLDYMISIPTRLQFLERILFAASLTEQENLFARYLIELSLHDYTFNRFRCSKVAAAAVNLARQTLSGCSDAGAIWTPLLSHYSHYADEELVDAVRALHTLHCNTPLSPVIVATTSKYEAPVSLMVSRIACPPLNDLRFSVSSS